MPKRTVSKNPSRSSYREEYDEIEAVKIKNIDRPVKNRKVKGNNISKTTPNTSLGSVISDTPVPCKCNKCNADVVGLLIGSIFTPLTGLETPFVSYDCPKCNHSGRRSVQSLAIPTLEFSSAFKLK